MKYSAGIVSKLFWDIEAKKTAELFLKGMNKNEIKDYVLKENIYQAPNDKRAKDIFGCVYKRIKSLDVELLEFMTKGDLENLRIINMVSIMLNERIVFDFMYEVYRQKIIYGEIELTETDFNKFIEDKKSQSEDVAKWTDYTISNIKQTIYRMLANAQFIRIDEMGKKIIKIPIINFDICRYLENNNMKSFLYAMTGEK